MRSVLITGGAGFFGRGFARECIARGVERVCIYSRGEYQQALMREEFGNHQNLRFFVGDVRDRDRLAWAMGGVDVVVHAAALKRVEVGEYNPTEMRKTNVGGTENVVWAARHSSVKKVVGLSSDKAFEPANTYGLTKALAEDTFRSANRERGSSGPIFAVTRYGNVAGSTGSVIPTWRKRIEAGEPVSVTSLECTRFWMTLQQAVDLVMTTIDTMVGGECNIPTLPAFRLGDLVEAMDPPGMVVTGLGRGEKLHESMGPGNSSDMARRMTVKELREALKHV